MLSPGQRISMIRESATLLDKQEWDDIDLVLRQHGLPTSNFGVPDTKSAYVKEMIDRADDNDLLALHTYLTSEAGSGRSGQSPWSAERLRLFCSHLAEHKQEVGLVGDALARYGIEPFIAHDSIAPSQEWIDVIEAALDDCDAMIVFLHDGFIESKWCDQEVGWALSRKRPVLPLNYGIHPYGFLGRLQDQPCAGASPHRVATYVLDWLVKTPSLHGRLGRGLVEAFVHSPSWNFTRSVVPYLEGMNTIEDDDLTRMERAAQDNVNVRECGIGGISGPDWVDTYVKKRRGPTAPATWPESDEPPF